MGRRETSYRALDFHTNDSSRPYQIRTGDGIVSSVGGDIPKALLPLPRSKVEQALDRPMSGREGGGVLVMQFLDQLAADTTPYQAADGCRDRRRVRRRGWAAFPGC
ncbi:hypothetical protein ACWGI9_41755 [Streptomyces sp. NPDC054833]